ncbi:MAG: hypothetical protein K0R84_999 [Clostridia bacterium]|jgi:hypothetical protein|nr:hypothetical protein [Clostridia bacterium]
MPYGKSEDIKNLKKKVQEKLPGVDLDNLSQNDMKNLLSNEINKNSNIDPGIKEKINKGDIDGLKEDLINFLGRSKDGNSQQLVDMLKNNDMDGLKNQLMGMLLGGMDTQKKKEVDEEDVLGLDTNSTALTPVPFDTSILMNSLMGRIYDTGKNDKRAVFLNSMRPFLSEKRQKSIDECVRAISLIALFEGLTNKVGS